MRVAAVQFKARKGDPASAVADKLRALEQLAQLADEAAPNRNLVVLPEMAATGYLFDGPEQVSVVAERSRGSTFDALSPVARRHGCWLVVGFPERAGDRLFNSALVIDPAGELAFTYRKTLLYEADFPWATPGDSGYRAFDTDAGRFGVGICMDLNDDRFVGWARRAELRAVALPTNWVHSDRTIYDVWTYWALRMTYAPGVALVAANTFGPERDTVFSGESAILQGFTVLDAAAATGNEIVRATLPERKRS